MSSRSAGRVARMPFLLVALGLCGSLGCWEQWSNEWFPQMKWQPAVQAFERTMHEGRVDPFSPPDGAVPISGSEPWLADTDDAAANALANPRPMSLASLENGRENYLIYCSTCHGMNGQGDGPVSMLGDISGPIAAVLPIAGPASIARVRSDGHLYTSIRNGRRRMPSYQRIPAEDRWDIVNFVRYLNQQKGVAP